MSAEADRWLSMSDDEVLAAVRAEGRNPEAVGSDVRKIVEKALAAAGVGPVVRRYTVDIPIARCDEFEKTVRAMRRTKKCLRCGADFYYQRTSRRFCSDSCRASFFLSQKTRSGT